MARIRSNLASAGVSAVKNFLMAKISASTMKVIYGTDSDFDSISTGSAGVQTAQTGNITYKVELLSNLTYTVKATSTVAGKVYSWSDDSLLATLSANVEANIIDTATSSTSQMYFVAD